MAKLGKTMSGNALSMPSGESEVTRLWKEFRNVDASGDGYVSRKEMQSAAKKALKLSREEAETVFDMADVNGDNQLDFGEYFKVMTGVPLGAEYSRDLLNVFRELDGDNDGFITEKEIAKARKGEKVPERARFLDRLLTEADVDGDKRISLEEFAHAVSPAMLREIAATRLGASPEVLQLFTMLDVDGNGILARSELHALSASLGITPDDIDGIFDAAGPSMQELDFETFVKLNKTLSLTDFFAMMLTK